MPNCYPFNLKKMYLQVSLCMDDMQLVNGWILPGMIMMTTKGVKATVSEEIRAMNNIEPYMQGNANKKTRRYVLSSVV